MAIENIKIGSKNTLSHSPPGTAWASVDDVLLSWNEKQMKGIHIRILNDKFIEEMEKF